jgi:hypothetical protein
MEWRAIVPVKGVTARRNALPDCAAQKRQKAKQWLEHSDHRQRLHRVMFTSGD